MVETRRGSAAAANPGGGGGGGGGRGGGNAGRGRSKRPAPSASPVASPTKRGKVGVSSSPSPPPLSENGINPATRLGLMRVEWMTQAGAEDEAPEPKERRPRWWKSSGPSEVNGTGKPPSPRMQEQPPRRPWARLLAQYPQVRVPRAWVFDFFGDSAFASRWFFGGFACSSAW